MEATNKLIAEFMGFQKTTIGWYDYEESLPNTNDNTFDSLKFHNSWDWLMPVIKKVKDTHNLFEGLEVEWFVQTIEDAVWNDKVRLAYDAVVNIIEP